MFNKQVLDENYKKCFHCNEIKTKKEFHKDRTKKDGHHTYCKVCTSEHYKNNKPYKQEYDKEYRKKNKEKQYSQTLEWQKNNPDSVRNSRLKSKYNINLTIYNNMLKEQNYCCKICKSTIPGDNKKYFSVDHCHITNKVRGLLCNSCNKGLGMFKDNIDILDEAIKYLQYESAYDEKCKEVHSYMLKEFGMECGLCGHNSIWEEKLKNLPKDLTMEQWLEGVPSKVKKMPE